MWGEVMLRAVVHGSKPRDLKAPPLRIVLLVFWFAGRLNAG